MTLSTAKYLLENFPQYIDKRTGGFYYNTSAIANGFNSRTSVLREVTWTVETRSSLFCYFPRLSFRDFVFLDENKAIPREQSFQVVINGTIVEDIRCNRSFLDECIGHLQFMDLTEAIGSEKASEIKTDILYVCHANTYDGGCLQSFKITMGCFAWNEQEIFSSFLTVSLSRSLMSPSSGFVYDTRATQHYLSFEEVGILHTTSNNNFTRRSNVPTPQFQFPTTIWGAGNLTIEFENDPFRRNNFTCLDPSLSLYFSNMKLNYIGQGIHIYINGVLFGTVGLGHPLSNETCASGLYRKGMPLANFTTVDRLLDVPFRILLEPIHIDPLRNACPEAIDIFLFEVRFEFECGIGPDYIAQIDWLNDIHARNGETVFAAQSSLPYYVQFVRVEILDSLTEGRKCDQILLNLEVFDNPYDNVDRTAIFMNIDKNKASERPDFQCVPATNLCELYHVCLDLEDVSSHLRDSDKDAPQGGKIVYFDFLVASYVGNSVCNGIPISLHYRASVQCSTNSLWSPPSSYPSKTPTIPATPSSKPVPDPFQEVPLYSPTILPQFPTTSPTKTPDGREEEALNWWIILLIVLGGSCVIVLCIAAIVYCKRIGRRRVRDGGNGGNMGNNPLRNRNAINRRGHQIVPSGSRSPIRVQMSSPSVNSSERALLRPKDEEDVEERREETKGANIVSVIDPNSVVKGTRKEGEMMGDQKEEGEENGFSSSSNSDGEELYGAENGGEQIETTTDDQSGKPLLEKS